MADADGPCPYPFSEPHRLDLDPAYAELHQAGVCLLRVSLPYGESAWLAVGYEGATTVLGDPRFSRAAAAGRDQPRTRAHVLNGEATIMGWTGPCRLQSVGVFEPAGFAARRGPGGPSGDVPVLAAADTYGRYGERRATR
ncbi:hypothetical protein [Streptomyces sp. NPDC126503]|uniref:hypothetical protein n=1 Tax=Streptomyces sp. NPDC126503 TaxID=3155315 RepID=UPI00332C1A1E